MPSERDSTDQEEEEEETCSGPEEGSHGLEPQGAVEEFQSLSELSDGEDQPDQPEDATSDWLANGEESTDSSRSTSDQEEENQEELSGDQEDTSLSEEDASTVLESQLKSLDLVSDAGQHQELLEAGAGSREEDPPGEELQGMSEDITDQALEKTEEEKYSGHPRNLDMSQESAVVDHPNLRFLKDIAESESGSKEKEKEVDN